MKKLVYYCIGFDYDYNNLLEISLFSLKTHYSGDILIITTFDNSMVLKNNPIFKDVLFLICDIDDKLSSMISRFKIFEYRDYKKYDYMLYLDCDTIIINNIDVFFNNTLLKNKIGVYENIESQTLNSSIMTLPINPITINMFTNIFRDCKKYNNIQMGLDNNLINSNYYFILSNYHISGNYDPILDINTIYNKNKISIVHFTNTTTSDKFNRMLMNYPKKIINLFSNYGQNFIGKIY